MTRWDQYWPRLLQIAGLLGIVHETLVSKVERPSLLLLFAGMAGINEVKKAQERRNKRRTGQ